MAASIIDAHQCGAFWLVPDLTLMPRDGAIIFSDLVGKLDVLQVECVKCGREGRYALARLIEPRTRYGKVIDKYDWTRAS